jgi:hypothetical protein
MEYAASRGVLKASSIPQRLRQKTRKDTIDSLVQAGFLELSASKPLALTRSREKKKKKEEEVRRAGAREPGPAHAPAASEKFPALTGIPANNDAELAYARVARMINLGVLHDQVDLEAEIRGFKITGRDADRLRQLMP